MLKNKILISAALLILIFTVSIKVKSTYSQNSVNKHPAEPLISKTLIDNNWKYIGKIRSINSNNYSAETFLKYDKKQNCKGLMFITAIPYNSEAEFFLGYPAGKTATDMFLILNSKIYNDFPRFELWKEKIMDRITNLVNNSNEVSIVLGVASTGTCVQSRNLPWDTIMNELYPS